MRLFTKLSAEQYIRCFRQQMGSFSSFGEERFTGFFRRLLLLRDLSFRLGVEP